MVLILSDADVARSCTASRAITVIRKAIHAHGDGRLAAPPRAHTAMTRGSLVFTAGALDGLVHGMQVHDEAGSEQVVAVWDATTGRLSAVVLGHELGRRRTGAIGAVAIDTLARPNAATLGVIGTGHQAWAQVWAATAVRTWRAIAIYSRNPYVRERFAARCREQLLVDAVAVDRPDAAVRGKDAVIVATSSSRPVFDTSWLDPGTHVSTLGPKTISSHEVPLDLLDRVDVLVTDSLAQVHGLSEPYALSTRRMVELGAVLTGALPGRTDPEQITLFCSVGLAGTEVVLAADLSGLPTGPTPAMTAALPLVSMTQQVSDIAASEATAALADPTHAEPTPPNGMKPVGAEAATEAAEAATDQPAEAADDEATEAKPGEEPAEAKPDEEPAEATAAESQEGETGAAEPTAEAAEPETAESAEAEEPPSTEAEEPPSAEADHEPVAEEDAGLDLVLGKDEAGADADLPAPAEPARVDRDSPTDDRERPAAAEPVDERAEGPDAEEEPSIEPETVTVGAEHDDKRRRPPGKRLPKPRGRA